MLEIFTIVMKPNHVEKLRFTQPVEFVLFTEKNDHKFTCSHILVWFGFLVKWYINLHGLFYANATPVKTVVVLLNPLVKGKRGSCLTKSISLKVNEIT